MDSHKQNQHALMVEAEPVGAASPPRPTQRTIAELTGLAVTTVSKALAGDEKIALQTRARVAEVAERIGYVPDRAAQRLRTGRTNVIALVLDPHAEMIGFSDSMIRGIAEHLGATPFHLVLMQHELGEDPTSHIRRIVRNRLADGVVFARTSAFDERVSFLLDADFPFVTHGRTRLAAHPWVDYDNEAFAEMAVERLAARGAQRIALIAPSSSHMFASHMTAGFQRRVAGLGVEGRIPSSFDLHSAPEDIRRGVFDMMNRPDPPDGWVCPGEIAAMAVNAAQFDRGATDASPAMLVSKRTSPAIGLLRPGVDFIHEDLVDTGRRLADLLLKRVYGAPPWDLNHLMPPVPSW